MQGQPAVSRFCAWYLINLSEHPNMQAPQHSQPQKWQYDSTSTMATTTTPQQWQAPQQPQTNHSGTPQHRHMAAASTTPQCSHHNSHQAMRTKVLYRAGERTHLRKIDLIHQKRQ